MARRLLTEEQHQFFIKNVEGKSDVRMAELMNERFGLSLSNKQVHAYKCNHKIRNNVPHSNRNQGIRLFNAEQFAYFKTIYKGRLSKETADLINKKFGTSFTPLQIRAFRRNNGFDSGVSGRFQKGVPSYNKGKKFPGRTNSGTFKSGHIPVGQKPVGSIVKTKDGYHKIKIADPKTWVLCHRYEWEKHNGPIPDGYTVAFLDGDRSNWDISNLCLVSKGELAGMNMKRLFSTDPELTKAGLSVLRIESKIREVQK
ncbi:HNH endonuclease signature motif containing protein [Streptococcus uberis]|uniref:HNH endonuclease signature motif containing protein n=1 Tax=Streptococcus uberis TaxID=1349 RepID=UPI00193A03CD|nr:HNH endonuclease signature motif containing protein [Streptococcus uberis]